MDIKLSTNQEKYQNVKSPELFEKLVKSTPAFCSQTAQCLANGQLNHTYDLGFNQAVIFHLMKHDRQTLAFQNESIPPSQDQCLQRRLPLPLIAFALQPFTSPSAELQNQVCQAHGGKSVKSMSYVSFGKEEEEWKMTNSSDQVNRVLSWKKILSSFP